MSKTKILVVGAMNVDVFVNDVSRLPVYGESVLCGDYGTSPGGKGANQAVAAALLGADVYMVGCVGDDRNAEELFQNLKKLGIHTDYVKVKENCQTGVAFMMLNRDGRYVCYVSMGGNSHIKSEDAVKAMDSEKFDMILMQLEMPLDTMYAVNEEAKKRNIPVILDAGPAMALDLERLNGIFMISPNEAETNALTGIMPDTEENARKAAGALFERSKAECVVLKLGERGALHYDGKQYTFVPSYKVKAIDSTAAGDTFTAALAMKLCEGTEMEQAIRFANAAAGICVSRQGAQNAIPTEQETLDFMAAN